MGIGKVVSRQVYLECEQQYPMGWGPGESDLNVHTQDAVC